MAGEDDGEGVARSSSCESQKSNFGTLVIECPRIVIKRK